MIEARTPRIVVTIHGIQTQGKWQKDVTPHFARHGLVPYHIHYGWFSAFAFFFPWSRNKQVQAVRAELRDLVFRTGVRRFSVFAHSFGTFLAMEALSRENGNLKYDRVVLTGSILPRDYDWKDILEEKKWVMAVRNERATSDWVVAIASFVSNRLRWISGLRAGDSGRSEFDQKPPALIDASVFGAHSEVLNVATFERAARFTSYPNLPLDLLNKVRTEMQALRQEAAAIVEECPDRIRINLFAPIDGALRIVPGAVDNMTYAPEYEVSIEPNHGATGTAFVSGAPCIVVKTGNSWTGNHLPTDQLARINPSLRSVLSLPVKSDARDMIVGVVNVDGLDNIPAKFQDRKSKECQATMVALWGGMLKRFQPCLDAAFRGEELSQVEA